MRLNVGAERRSIVEDLIWSADAAQTPVLDYWSGARHASNMTRGRRLGPEENHAGGLKKGSSLAAHSVGQVVPQSGW